MDAVALAEQIDTEFRASCARNDDDEPFHGIFALASKGKTVEYKVGSRGRRDERIVDGCRSTVTAF